MLPENKKPHPIDDLTAKVCRISGDLNAICIMATDESGGLLSVSDENTPIDLQTLAALGTANLASAMQLLSLAEQTPLADDALITLVESAQTRLIVAGKTGGLIVIALLGAQSPLGLARIEMHELANINWEIPPHNFSSDNVLIEEELASRDLFDDLFNPSESDVK